MWVCRRLGQDIFDNAFRQFAGALILFENDHTVMPGLRFERVCPFKVSVPHLIQEYSKVEITGGLTILCQKGSSLTAMLGSMIHNMQ